MNAIRPKDARFVVRLWVADAVALRRKARTIRDVETKRQLESDARWCMSNARQLKDELR